MTALGQVGGLVERWMRDRGVPGATLAVTDREQLLGLSVHGVADAGSRRPVTPETLFEIGSLGKPFTSISLLQLQDEGLLDVEAPVSDYLPWFRVRSRYGPIAVRHLLNHTAGLVRGTDIAPHGLFESWALHETEAGAPPGEYFWYSNVGYKTLGFLLERQTGRTLPEVVRSRILEPLGMASTHPGVTLTTRLSAATGHRGLYDDRPEHASHPVVPADWAEYATGDGCQASTASDMAAYLRMLLNRGRGPGGRVISEDGFGLLTENGVWTGGDYYGYGLATYPGDGRTYIGHGGGNAGFRSAIVVDMEAGLGVVVLLNRMGETDPVVELAQHLLTIVRAEHRGEPPPPPLPADATLVPGAPEYEGIYGHEGRTLRVAAEGGRLRLTTGDRTVTLERRAADAFHVPLDGFELFLLEFGRRDGRVVEAFHGPDWYAGAADDGPTELEPPATWAPYEGHYRSRSPELSNFRVVRRKDGLVLIIPWGTSERLVALGDGVFRVGADERSPERLRFDAIVDGRALRATYSGCPCYRAATP